MAGGQTAGVSGKQGRACGARNAARAVLPARVGSNPTRRTRRKHHLPPLLGVKPRPYP